MRSLEHIKPEHRFIETVSPGFLFGETCDIKWPSKSWLDVHRLADELKRKSKTEAVGFRRFIYDPSYGKQYLDPDWKYFKGRKFTMAECLDGIAKKICPSIPLNDIAMSNIRNNKWDVLYMQEYCKLWPLEEDDEVLQ